MRIEQTINVIFDADKECEDAIKFGKDHPDWHRFIYKSTRRIKFIKSVNLTEGVN